LKTQADIVETLVAGRPALLIAHDLGDSVATELMARDLDSTLTFALSGVMMTNSSVIIDKLSYFNRERDQLAPRWEGAIRDWPGRFTVGWGGQDHISGRPVLEAIINLNPDGQVVRWPELGHFPQIEDPATVSSLAVAFAASDAIDDYSDG
jgi:hypothetical protein